MAGEKKSIIDKIVGRLYQVLVDGDVSTRLKELRGEIEPLTEREFVLYQEILDSWKAQLGELEE